MADKFGSMVCRQPVLLHLCDWVIPEFHNLAKSANGSFSGPDFIIQDKTFFIGLLPNTSVCIWLGKRSQAPIIVNHFSFSLVANDGSELVIGSKPTVTFTETYLNTSVEDATFQKFSLQPKFLPNGELRIRCRIQIESSQEKKQETPIQDNSLLDDMTHQIAEQNLPFPDVVLVCNNREFFVHRFMLATCSLVFKTLLINLETLAGPRGKVIFLNEIRNDCFKKNA